MSRAHVWGPAIFWIAAMNTGCSETPAGTGKAAAAGTSTPDKAEKQMKASAGTGAPKVTGSTGGRSGAVAGGSADKPGSQAGDSAADKASRAAASGAKSAAVGGAAGGADVAAMGGASGANGGSGGTAGQAPEGSVPTPVDTPQIWGFGIGVSDVAAATDYFKDVMRVEVEKDAIKRDGWTETTLFSTRAPRGGRLSLLAFDDVRETRNITAKLIWKVKETAPIDAVASKYPDYMKYLDSSYVMFEGPDRYIQEISNELDPDGGDVEDPYLVAVGFVVSDGDAARKFYTDIGMTDKSLGSYPITDPTGFGTVGEYSERYGVGRAIVLQTWSPTRNAKDNPVKVVIAVPDANAMAEMVVAAGGTMVSQASRSDLYDNRLVIVAKDLDGYLLDLVE